MNNVSELDNEISELKGFIADLKADRAAQKEKERKESWTKYTSMSLVFIAVLAAIASQWAGRYGSQVLVQLNNSTYDQAQASDKWSYYQAKSIKQNLYEALREAGLNESGTNAAAIMASFNAKIEKYKAEEKQISDEAKELEKTRDAARAAADLANERGRHVGTAISIFQIAIALGSICLVTKKRPLWYLSLIIATAAVFKMCQAWPTS